jgi:hypothetical protein
MFASRRKSERRPCRELSKIQLAMGTLPRDCVVTDVSDGGLRAFAENVEVPAEFLMILSNGKRRQCRLVWRIGCEFGAEFIG